MARWDLTEVQADATFGMGPLEHTYATIATIEMKAASRTYSTMSCPASSRRILFR